MTSVLRGGGGGGGGGFNPDFWEKKIGQNGQDKYQQFGGSF